MYHFGIDKCSMQQRQLRLKDGLINFLSKLRILQHGCLDHLANHPDQRIAQSAVWIVGDQIKGRARDIVQLVFPLGKSNDREFVLGIVSSQDTRVCESAVGIEKPVTVVGLDGLVLGWNRTPDYPQNQAALILMLNAPVVHWSVNWMISKGDTINPLERFSDSLGKALVCCCGAVLINATDGTVQPLVGRQSNKIVQCQVAKLLGDSADQVDTLLPKGV